MTKDVEHLDGILRRDIMTAVIRACDELKLECGDAKELAVRVVQILEDSESRDREAS
ncbi:hypothetical protein Q0601_17680 [Paracoccus onubensis]|uniref:hypothetical protein n=1 Tax=Paracoccus onubensis TaxID=1675788 RepID=UPI00272F9BA4|nr:hypothetical protein [Paracoccus onubensis]MDP0929019.1 hypothetical protein [Paracoccus onubensis]